MDVKNTASLNSVKKLTILCTFSTSWETYIDFVS